MILLGLAMGKYKRGGYVFVTWKGDHLPKHIHVFKNGRLVLKWNLEANLAMRGKASRRLRFLIDELKRSKKI